MHMSIWYTSTSGVPVVTTAPEWRAGAADFDAAAALAGFAQPRLQEYSHGVAYYEHEDHGRWLFAFGFDLAHIVQAEGFPELLAFATSLASWMATGFEVANRPPTP